MILIHRYLGVRQSTLSEESIRVFSGGEDVVHAQNPLRGHARGMRALRAQFVERLEKVKKTNVCASSAGPSSSIVPTDAANSDVLRAQDALELAFHLLTSSKPMITVDLCRLHTAIHTLEVSLSLNRKFVPSKKGLHTMHNALRDQRDYYQESGAGLVQRVLRAAGGAAGIQQGHSSSGAASSSSEENLLENLKIFPVGKSEVDVRQSGDEKYATLGRRTEATVFEGGSSSDFGEFDDQNEAMDAMMRHIGRAVPPGMLFYRIFSCSRGSVYARVVKLFGKICD